MPDRMPTMSGQPKLRLRLSVEVLRQARSGPTPVRKRRARPTGIMILLKNGAPTLIRLLVNHSEKTGKSVPERTAMQATRKSREAHEPRADVRVRKRVHGTDNAAARKESAKNAEQERAKDQPDVPHLHHAALFLHHHGVQERRAGEPRKQRSVFDGIPAPVAAPTQNGVGPMRAEKNADRLETPRDHRPFAGEVNPFFAGIAREQRGKRKRERNGKTRIAGIKIRRVN